MELTLKEWQSRSALDAAEVDLHDVHLNGHQDRELAARLTRSNTLAVRDLACGREGAARAHVGRVSLGDVTITVEPKVGGQRLLKLFRYAHGLRRLNLLPPTGFAPTGQLFVDLVLAQLEAEARELMARGLHRKYIARREDLVSPRGRVDMLALARRGGRVERGLPCKHHPRSLDNQLNRALLAGLMFAGRTASDPKIKTSCLRHAAALQEGVARRPLSRELAAAAGRQMSRLTRAYAPALEIVALLADGGAVSLDEASGMMSLPGLLLDMNLLFQRLLERFLSEHLPAMYQVISERTLRGMMRYAPGKNPLNRPAPRPRPDFVIVQGHITVAMLDAKYRDLWRTPLPANMLYQLSIYALSRPADSTAVILYPTSSPGATEQEIEISDPVSGRRKASVLLRPVQLDRLLELIDSAHAKPRDACHYATWLALG